MSLSDDQRLAMYTPQEIGKAIKKRRRELKITQKEFAKRLGKSGINAFQASKRTGTMRCVCEEDRVKIYGDAVLFNTSVINIC